MFKSTIRLMPRPQEVARMTTEELRESFLVPVIHQSGALHGQFTDLDRLVVIGACPENTPLILPNHCETGRGSFLERRELGAINTGGHGEVTVDGETFPAATRHLFMHNGETVLSPPWSIHSGCGQGSYKFIWGMAGENQLFTDMDAIKPTDLR